MVNEQKLKGEFDRAKHALMMALLASDGCCDADVQPMLDAMTRAFHELLVSTLETYSGMPPVVGEVRENEYLCAYAVNLQNGWDGSDWRVTVVQGDRIDTTVNAPTLRDFTRQMVDDGWEIVPAAECAVVSLGVMEIDGIPVHELYFRRPRVALGTRTEASSQSLTLPPSHETHSAN